jgi:predicted nucleotide-binding protein
MGMNETNNTWQELTETIERMKNEPTPPSSVTIETANTVMDMLQEKEEFVDAAMEKTAEIIDEPFRPRNRAERRALDKATRRQKQKKRRMFVDSIKETAEKLAYINMIEKVRALNEQIKAEGEKENEAAN